MEGRTTDFLRGRNAVAMEKKKRRKRLDLCLSLHHGSASASDSYSPRALLSRFLLSFHKPSPPRSGGGGKALGCLMRFPSPCSNDDDEEEEEEEEEDERKGEAEVEDGEKDAEGGGGRAPLPLESATVEGATVGSGEKGRKPEEVSVNLGMGMGLVFLLARSSTQFNKMIELREHMEMLFKDIKDEIQRKEMPPNYTETNNNTGSSASNGNKSNCISLQSDKSSYSLQRLQSAMRSAAWSKCDVAVGSKRCLKIDQIESEFEVELEHLQLNSEDRDPSAFLQQNRMELTSGNENLSESFSVSSHEGNEVESSFHCGVNPRELERRLHELLETRQQERIAELESALECAGKMIHEKDIEIYWWRDTARLVSQHKDETLFR